MSPSKGEATRERILECASKLASRDGLEGLSIGALATELGLSKSGLFAHFGSKEDLQVAVLEAAAQRFEDRVVNPALSAPRGRPRIKRWFDEWLRWVDESSTAGGCLFISASVELDDCPCKPRDILVKNQKQLMKGLARAAALAVEEGHFRKNLDCEQFAFELEAIVLGYSHSKRLLRDPHAEKRVRAAFERLLASAAA